MALRFTTALAVLGLLAAVGCSDQTEKPATDAQQTSTSTRSTGTSSYERVAEEAGSTAQLIEDELSEEIARLRLGDKSGLWENEFGYLHDEMDFDDYRQTGQVNWAQADTIEFLDVQSVAIESDSLSAEVGVEVTFKPPSGKEHSLVDTITVYYTRGRWIKPTVSTREMQDEYEDLVRAADSAAKAEASH